MPLLRVRSSEHRDGDSVARTFVETAEFRAASLDPLPDPTARRFLVRAALDIYSGDLKSAFLHTLRAAWVADDCKQTSDAAALRLKAAAYLSGNKIRSIDTRLLLLDVLRRASSWEAAGALVAELAAEDLEYPFAEIVAFHACKIEARDIGQDIRSQRHSRANQSVGTSRSTRNA